MQHIFAPGDEGYHYSGSLEVKDVTVVFDPSLMTATHNYSCPVCRENHAVLSDGVMQPCRACEGDWRLMKIDHRTWFQKLIGADSE